MVLIAAAVSLRLIICGGRSYQNRSELYRALDAVHAKRGIALVIHGGAAGADSLAEAWAFDRGVPARSYPANWGRYGKGAGPIRNGEMIRIEKPDGVIAFPGHSGTKNMIDQARGAGIPVWEPVARRSFKPASWWTKTPDEIPRPVFAPPATKASGRRSYDQIHTD